MFSFKWKGDYVETQHTTYILKLHMKICNKNAIFYLDYSIVFPHNGFRQYRRALLNTEPKSVFLKLNTMINPKTLDMLQDSTFRSWSKMHLKRRKNIGSCIVKYNIVCRFFTFHPWFLMYA
jgi:hypothetical protein